MINHEIYVFDFLVIEWKFHAEEKVKFIASMMKNSLTWVFLCCWVADPDLDFWGSDSNLVFLDCCIRIWLFLEGQTRILYFTPDPKPCFQHGLSAISTFSRSMLSMVYVYLVTAEGRLSLQRVVAVHPHGSSPVSKGLRYTLTSTTECLKIYRKSVLHLLKYGFAVY